MKVRQITSSVLLLVLIVLACGPTVVNIPVQKPAEVDVRGIRKIAIVDFRGPERSGQLAASILTAELLKNGFFQIFEREKIDRILEEHKLAMSGVVDESTARKVGQLLGVDALIFGEVVTYRIEPDQKGVEKVEKKVGTGKYRIVTRGKKKVREEIKKTVLVDQPYLIRRGSVSVASRMVDVETGRLIASKAMSRDYSSGKIIEGRGRLKAKDAILNDLLTEIMKQFARQISPHKVMEKLSLENGKGSIKTGVQYAKNGLWREAMEAFAMAVREQPRNPAAHYDLGLSLLVVGKFDLAEKEIKKAIALKNKNLYFRALARVQKFREEQSRLRQQVGGPR